MHVRSPRPRSVTGLVVLAFTLGVLSTIAGLGAVGLWYLGPSDLGSASIFLLILGTVIFAFGILEFTYGIGFLGGERWSWTLGMVVAVVSLVSSLTLIGIAAVSIPPASTGSTVVDLWIISITSVIVIMPIIVGSVTVYFLTRPDVKAFFRKGLPAAENHASPMEVN